MGRIALLAAAALLVGTPAEAYYHYVHFTNTGGTLRATQEKFNLASLTNNTVTFFVNDQGPAVFAANDSFGSILGQVKQALAAWDAVSTSDLRVGFGGTETSGQNSNTPGGDVIFQDLPPGVLGLGAPTSSGTTIVRGTVILSNNTGRTGPSYLEGFYTTAIHEIGHALGLQHTWTSSAMSQDLIRNTSRTRPLDADDVAALSILYGKANWTANYGSISGRVTFTNGTPVAMASVVAISPNGPAVSALTDPNGNYRIDGVPANNYLLYAHPLPPGSTAADNSGLRLPVDQNGASLPPSGFFGTVFYPGTLDPQQATTISVTRGSATAGRDFSVQPRAAVAMYDMVTYSYFEPATRTSAYSANPATAVKVTPAYINTTQGAMFVRANSNSGDTPIPQAVTILGGFGTVTTDPYLHPYAASDTLQRTLALYFGMPLGAGTGPRHMVFTLNNDMYVLPNAINLVQRNAPVINAATPNADGSAVTLTGSGFGPDSVVFFDGLQAPIQASFSGSDAQGSITVAPPPGVSGQVSTITVVNSDGQNSMFLQGSNPPTYSYQATGAPQIAVDKNSLPAGATAMVDITGSGTHFAEGLVTVGFGSEDILVQRVWVLSPTHLQANVVVSPNAALGASEISVLSGFQVISQPFAFQVQPANPSLPVIALPIANADFSQQTIYPGAIVSIFGSNLAPVPARLQLTLNDTPVAIQFASGNQINFVVPAGFPTGPAVVKLNNGSAAAFPVLLQVDNPPPAIRAVNNVSGVSMDSSHFAVAGDVLNILVTGLDPTVVDNASRVHVTVSGLDMPVLGVTSAWGGQYQIQCIVKQSFGGAVVPVAVSVDGSSSASFTITVR
jgi:uncharacterized protein (TIGR03437 family)